MNPRDPNIQLLEAVASALGDLRDDLVFVGGCAAGLLCTSPVAAPPRVTYDVDVVAEVATLTSYHALERRFAACGFKHDTSPDAPICRWRMGNVVVDLMPSEEHVLGFANRWYPLAMSTSTSVSLPSNTTIRLIAAPVFIATKFEAFATRGRSDMMMSHDFEDIVNVIGGRPGIEDEIADAPPQLVKYLSERFLEVASQTDFDNILPGLITHDDLYADRLEATRSCIKAIIALTSK
ncbi:MAG TPA: hypothetical protein VHL14_10450 [Steroidobacteraceae bacterium]|nr:hypothetical protein [Steroidobacteraceae bacterium]